MFLMEYCKLQPLSKSLFLSGRGKFVPTSGIENRCSLPVRCRGLILFHLTVACGMKTKLKLFSHTNTLILWKCKTPEQWVTSTVTAMPIWDITLVNDSHTWHWKIQCLEDKQNKLEDVTHWTQETRHQSMLD